MAQMVTTLSAFLSSSAAQGDWQPGVIDCCMWLASWAVWLGHPDPATHLRDAYRDEEGYQAIIAAAGGMVPVVAECIEKIGGRILAHPECGAVGVIGSALRLDRQWGAIFDGERWLVRNRTGVVPVTASSLAIWEIVHA
jgi:hypothetical protein